jgi:endoglucanase
LKDLPFPGDAHAIPPLPDILRGTWIEDRFKSYASDATEAKLAAFLDKAVDYAKRYNVKVYCGEFGALMENNLREDRVRYYRMVTRLLDERNIARTSWNYYGSMGIFNSNSARNFYSELNVDIVEAMGFIAPPQEAPATIKTGFTIYDDYPGNNVEVRHWGWKEQNFYLDNTDAAEGRYAIKWSNPVAYEQFNWVFLNTVDWKSLLNSGYAIRFKAKAVLGESASGGPAFAFDVRFVDRQTEASPPWRMRYRITEAVLPPDGGWHTVTIPLADMRESGAFWDGSWYGPEGKFDWGTIECLEFSWENDYTLKGDIRFDAIEITRDY